MKQIVLKTTDYKNKVTLQEYNDYESAKKAMNSSKKLWQRVGEHSSIKWNEITPCSAIVSDEDRTLFSFDIYALDILEEPQL